MGDGVGVRGEREGVLFEYVGSDLDENWRWGFDLVWGNTYLHEWDDVTCIESGSLS